MRNIEVPVVSERPAKIMKGNACGSRETVQRP